MPLKRSHSSHSLNSYKAAESQSLFLSRLDHQTPFQFGMSLCKRLHLVMSLTRCPRRRLFNRTCFRVMWPFRRLSMGLTPYPWTLLRRRPHPVPCLSMSLRRWVLAQLPRFLLIRLCRLQYAVWCNRMLPHNYHTHGVLYWLYLLEQSFGPPKPCSSVSSTNAGFTCFTSATAWTRTASPSP